jgi:exodeoxyribonuclease VII small subunit
MAQKEATDYKTLSTELDDILAQLQDPETDIDKALILYKRGLQVAKELEQNLKITKNTIKKITLKSTQ